jgi:hypothetical protein
LVAQPALAQLRATGDTARLNSALRAVGLAMLLLSGAVAIGLVAVNEAFVKVWVGPDHFSGVAISLLAIAAMTARHLAFTWWSAAYVLGFERRLSLVLITDGVVTVAAMAGWTALLGASGIPLGALTGVLFVYLPTGLFALASGLGLRPIQLAKWVLPWGIRFAVIIVPVAIASAYLPALRSMSGACAVAVASLGLYAVLSWGLARREPLRPYAVRAVAVLRDKLSAFVASPSAASSSQN